jgi:hypothetical protein
LADVTEPPAPDATTYYQEMRERLEARLASLPAESLLRAALPEERLDTAFADVRRQLERAGSATPLISLPPLILFCDRRSDGQLAAFEEDLQRVVERTPKPLAVKSFLGAGVGEPGRWCGGLFEIYVKARLRRIPGLAVDFDVPLPNGRDIDVVAHWRGRKFPMECTVLTESDEDRVAWDRFLEKRKVDTNAILIRPGPFDVKDSKGPSPYYDTLRVYAKVYDKLAPVLDPRRAQLLPDAPNLILLAFWSPTAPLDARSLGVRWAVAELFGPQPRTRVAPDGEGGIDISLPGWLDYTASDLVQKARLTREQYVADYRELVSAPRETGGLLLFDQGNLKELRFNPEADRGSTLSIEEAALIESWFKSGPYWL